MACYIFVSLILIPKWITKTPIQAMIIDLHATYSSKEDEEDDQDDDFDDDIDNYYLQTIVVELQTVVSYYHVILDYKGPLEPTS